MTAPSFLQGPKGHPLLGHAWGLSRGGLAYLRACARDYGDLVPLRFFGKRILFVNHPDHVGQVLAANHRQVVKGTAHRTDRALTSDGLSLSEGDPWRHGRRIVQPAFHRERLAGYGEITVAFAERLTEGWRDGETRDVDVAMRELTTAIVARTLFGIDVRSDAAELPAALASALDCRNARARSPQLLLPDRFPTPTAIRMRRARRRIDAVIQRIVDERRAAGDDRDDLLAMLLHTRDEDGRAMTDQQVRNEVLTMFVAGTETVADLLAWIWYLLSQHPEVEDRLRAELAAALGGRSPTVSDLSRLPYAGMVVSEALRLYPPASVLAREVVADFDLGNYRVARGTEVLVSPWVMHRDARYFVDPDGFSPDRWADGLARRLPPYAYFPFGGGSRRCIGKSFALLEATLVLATIAQRYRFDLVAGHPVVAEPIPTLRPKFGLPMVVHARPRTTIERGARR